METTKLVPATAAHAHGLAPKMRREDAAEALAWTGLPPLETLLTCLSSSTAAWAFTSFEEVLAMCGVGPSANWERVGIVWVLSGRGVERHKMAYARASRVMVERMLQEFPVLINAVDSRYEDAIKWVRWLGFEVDQDKPVMSPGGVPFYPAKIQRCLWAQ